MILNWSYSVLDYDLDFQDLISLQLGFPHGSMITSPPANVGGARLILGSGRSPGEGNGHPPQYSCLRNPMDGGDLWATVCGVAES